MVRPKRRKAPVPPRRRPQDKRLRELEEVLHQKIMNVFITPKINHFLEWSKGQTFVKATWSERAMSFFGSRRVKAQDDFDEPMDVEEMNAMDDIMFEAYSIGGDRAKYEFGVSFDFSDPSIYQNITPEFYSYVYQMDKDLAVALDQVIRESKDYREVAERIQDEVERTYANRSHTIAVTELSRVATEGYGEVIRRSGMSGMWRFNVSDDDLVCEDCEAMDGETYESEEEVPVHPNCRCWMTFIPDEGSDEVEEE